jgi:hypothetical protein
MYRDGFTPEQIMYAHHNKIMKAYYKKQQEAYISQLEAQVKELQQQVPQEITITSEVKVK